MISLTPIDANHLLSEPHRCGYSHKRFIISIVSVVVILFLATIFAATPPSNFPANTSRVIISVSDGMTLTQTAAMLQEKHIIRSKFLYKSFVVLLGGSTRVIRGQYLFDEPQSALRIAYRTLHGVQGIAKIKVTIPEGADSGKIGDILQKTITAFDANTFRMLAKKEEGYLFPDTYYFLENVTPHEVISTMKQNFDTRIVSVSNLSLPINQNIANVITMASIIEKEATSSFDRQVIAGILWKRLDDKMPLQVDAPFFYFLDKTSSQLTLDDLAVDSPYNLYKNKGLPPTPISNPGLETIMDTINATTTKYWFYLSDKNGLMHYAVTFEDHLVNKAKYLQ